MIDKEVGELWEWVTQVRLDDVTDPEIRWIIGRVAKSIHKLVEERAKLYATLNSDEIVGRSSPKDWIKRSCRDFGIDPESFK